MPLMMIISEINIIGLYSLRLTPQTFLLGDVMKIKDRLSKLIDVKTIVTFAMTGTFVFMCVIGKIESDTFVPIFSTILGWYYGSQSKKGENSESK